MCSKRELVLCVEWRMQNLHKLNFYPTFFQFAFGENAAGAVFHLIDFPAYGSWFQNGTY